MASLKTGFNIAIAKQDRLIRDVMSFFEDKTGLRVRKDLPRQDFGRLTGEEEGEALGRVRVWEFDVEKTLADVGAGKLQLAILGRDKLEEYQAKARAEGAENDIVMVRKLPVSACAMVIAVPEEAEDIASPRDLETLDNPVIATRYPSLTREWLAANGVRGVDVVEYNKSVEAAIPYGDAGAIADITQTGQSLRDNFLRQAFGVLESSACVVASRTALSNPETAAFIGNFCKALDNAPAPAMAA